MFSVNREISRFTFRTITDDLFFWKEKKKLNQGFELYVVYIVFVLDSPEFPLQLLRITLSEF